MLTENVVYNDFHFIFHLVKLQFQLSLFKIIKHVYLYHGIYHYANLLPQTYQ
jgi:uncharacterized protein YqhQ